MDVQHRDVQEVPFCVLIIREMKWIKLAIP